MMLYETINKYKCNSCLMLYSPHPADCVGVAQVGVRELCRHPAADRLSNILLHADQDGKEDEHARRILTIESIDEIIVGADFEVSQLEDGFEEFVHLPCSLPVGFPELEH